jgi:hypothetical protein
MTSEQKAAESAKYLKADVPSVGNPTWNYWDGAGRYLNITGADGKEYMFVPDDYVKKGLVQDGIQSYNKQFLDPATFKNSVQYSLPKGVQNVVNNNGYVWAVDDYNKLNLNSYNNYKIGPDDPAILGVGYPQQSLGQGNTISYITQPTLAPGLGGQQRVQQDFITPSGGRQVGYGSYSYYQNNDDFSKAFRGALQGLGPLTPILLDIFAGPGTGAIYSMSKAAGEASITGDWNKAATTIGTIMAAPYVSGAISGAVGSALDMGTLANSIIGNAVGNATVAGLTGGDPLAALINSGVGGAVGAIAGKIDGFSDLPPSVQKVFNATLRAELTGKDPSKAAILAATTSGLQAIKNGMDANAKFQSNYGREATPEELNNFAYVSTPEELNSSFDRYMADTAARSQAEAQAKIDEANQAETKALEKSSEEDAAAAKIESDRLAREAAEAKQKADDEAERLRLAGLQENTNVDPVQKQPATDQRLTEAINKGKSGDLLGQINLQREIVGLAPFASIDEFYATKEGKNLLGGQNNAETGNVVDKLVDAGLQENTNVDLNKVAAGTDVVAGGTGADTIAGTKGTDTTTGDGTAMGNTTKSLDGASAYKYDPATKTYTYTSDDGSTLTLDENGGVVGSTEATDTSWTGLTDKDTGNLKLPKLPGGLTPTVKPPAKKTTTTTTGTGNTATTTNTGTTTIGTGNTTTTTGTGNTATGTGTTTTGLSANSINAILNLLEGTGGGAQQQIPYTPAQIPVADIKSYYNTIRGISGENLLPGSKEEKENYGVDGLFAEGGTVDDLLRFLRG